jgi:membrane protease YdiL (CAAX protease family)
MNDQPRQGASPLSRIFVSSNGIRVGWVLAIFLVLYSALTLGAQFAFATIPLLRLWAASQPHGVITPIGQIAFTGLELIILLTCVTLVSKVERRSFADYGLSQPKTTGNRLLLGLLVGFGMASLLTGLIAIAGGYSAHGLAISGPEILKNACLYGFGFLLVALFEEFAFRGYLQATLQRGIGFWPAAVVLSIAFGAVHLPNLGGAWFASLAAASFGLVAAFSVQRTGSLWFIIGAHAAFDWGITFFYSAPIAGMSARGHLMNASLQGPTWLTGGNAGPVGSVFAFAVFALAGLMIHLSFRYSPALASTRQE